MKNQLERSWAVEFRVLGPVELWDGERRVDTGQPRQRAVLAGLLADAGRSVPAATLIDRVWGQDPPRGARQALHAHIARIRRMLEKTGSPSGITFDAGCYRLEVDPDAVDLHRFRLLTTKARACADDQRRVALLREAVRLWRGMPLSGLSGLWIEQSRQDWEQQFLSTAVLWAETELSLGHPDAVIGTLNELAASHPVVEPLTAVRMRALALANRPAEALQLYEHTRKNLVSELGADPSRELQELYRAILRGEQPQPVVIAPEVAPTPAQLPADVPTFAGRREHLARLDALLRERAIATVSGTAGVGKTTLVLHWAHTVAGQFPDGQLYLNLRGYDTSGAAMPAEEALRYLLEALGVSAERVPTGTGAKAALYRSAMANKRILLVLDNARDAEQVRPLLPATPGAMVVVTSRDRLTGLIVSNSAHPLNLEVLSDDEARALLGRRIGADRVDAQTAAVDRIIAACARLPLALAVTAARALQTGFALDGMADELERSPDLLGTFDVGDPASQVRGVFSWSYVALSAEAQDLFRMLSLHPGPDVSAPAAASLVGLPAPDTQRLLRVLVEANLLSEPRPGRYAYHDLLRAYAADLSASRDTDADRRTAMVRMLDHYVHTAYDVDRHLYPMRSPIELPLTAPAPHVWRTEIGDVDQATAWLEAECAAMIAIAQRIAATDFGIYAGQLAWLLDQSLYRRARWLDRATVWQAALRAAGNAGNLTALASAHRGVAHGDTLLENFDAAAVHLEQALDLYARSDDLLGQANVHYYLANLWGRQDQNDKARTHAAQALSFYRSTSHGPGQANALNQVGWYSGQLGDYAAALEACREALRVQDEIGDHAGQADTWDSIGYAHHHLGNHTEAIACYRKAIELFQNLDDRYAESETLTNLGDTHVAVGDPGAARIAWTRALDLLNELGHADVQIVRARLEAL